MVDYKAPYGAQLSLAGNIPVFGGWNIENAFPLTCSADGHSWYGNVVVHLSPESALAEGSEVSLPSLANEDDGTTGNEVHMAPELDSSFRWPFIEYKYIVVEADGSHSWEPGDNHTIDLEAFGTGSVAVRDVFNTSLHGFEHLMENTSAFRNVVYARSGFHEVPSSETSEDSLPQSSQLLVWLEVAALRVAPAHCVHVVGSCPELGAWDIAKALPLSDVDFPTWSAQVPIGRDSFPFEYKFVIKPKTGAHGNDTLLRKEQEQEQEQEGEEEASSSQATGCIWEDGPNRRAALGSNSPNTILLICHDDRFRLPAICRSEFRGTGIITPVFSLRSRTSMGGGEFDDLKALADFAASAGFKMLQLLPVNDTRIHNSWWDSYPYSSVSVFALHPMYIHLQTLCEGVHGAQDILREIEEKCTVLNQCRQMDYEAVVSAKESLLRQLYQLRGEKDLEGDDFQNFFLEAQEWLRPYALFMYLRNKFNEPNWKLWPEEFRSIDTVRCRALTDPGSEAYAEVRFNFFVQFHAVTQFVAVADYCSDAGVVLKGDIPIGVDPLSVDAWYRPDLFRAFQAGAPPDVFSEDGQNWGFPTYNWEVMARDDFDWWRRRLSVMSKFFQAYRIDHILGFFRIWEISATARSAICGHFHPATPIWDWEMSNVGLWDFNRLTDPYIKRHLLERYYGDRWTAICEHFLVSIGLDTFAFKEEFSNEYAIIDEVKKSGDFGVPFLDKSLCSLLQNVCFMRDESNPLGFHPRIDVKKTTSFQELPTELQREVEKLYVDYFYRRQDDAWSKEAMHKLPRLMDATPMLTCGEDLGMVPACVEGILNHLSILSLRIQRMAKDPAQDFDNLRDFPHLSVCTPSVHDTSSLRGWWEEDRGLTQKYYNEVLGEFGEAPRYCEPWVVRKILQSHMYTRSMWANFLISDVLALSMEHRGDMSPVEEQINIPAIRHHYWRYRIPIELEVLQADSLFIDEVKTMIRDSGRASLY